MRAAYDAIWPTLSFDRAMGKADTYRVSFGFYRDKSTGNMDLDGLAPIGKVAIDSWAQYMGINDNYVKIVEVRYVYLGHAPNGGSECVVMQVERL